MSDLPKTEFKIAPPVKRHRQSALARMLLKDLKESVELDRAAMRRITGGWSRQRFSGVPSFESTVLRKNTLREHLNLSGFDFGSDRW